MASGDTTRKGGNTTPVESANQTPPKRGQNGGGRRPVDSKVKAKVRRMAREGSTRNAIAREVGISPSTVTSICAAARPPITFDRSATKVAVEAAVADAKARRAKLANGLLDDADKLRDMFFKDREQVHYSVTLGEQRYSTPPSPSDIREMITAFGIAVDKHLVLVRHDADDSDLPAVDKFIAAMLGGTQ